MKEIYRMKRDYRAAERTLSRDVQFAYSACLGAMTRLIDVSIEREEHARAPRRLSLFTAERYAFRDAVCRRRIKPRSAWCQNPAGA
ncbi:MAG: hypothetical protein R2912_02505 [Eubacteriales bacterium]